MGPSSKLRKNNSYCSPLPPFSDPDRPYGDPQRRVRFQFLQFHLPRLLPPPLPYSVSHQFLGLFFLLWFGYQGVHVAQLLRKFLGGKQTRLSLHMGTISAEYVNLKLAVFDCVSAERRRSDAFDLNLDKHTTIIEGGDAHRMGTTPDRNSTSLCGPCFGISYSRYKNVRLCGTFCLAWTRAFH